MIKKKLNKDGDINFLVKIIKPIIIFTSAFLTGLICYIFMYYLFGFGGGMLISMHKNEYNNMLKTTLLKPLPKNLY